MAILDELLKSKERVGSGRVGLRIEEVEEARLAEMDAPASKTSDPVEDITIITSCSCSSSPVVALDPVEDLALVSRARRAESERSALVVLDLLPHDLTR